MRTVSSAMLANRVQTLELRLSQIVAAIELAYQTHSCPDVAGTCGVCALHTGTRPIRAEIQPDLGGDK